MSDARDSKVGAKAQAWSETVRRWVDRFGKPGEEPSDAASTFAIERTPEEAIEAERDLPPVVARMVVEVRSDGSRTVARGALEDIATGQRVAIRADGTTPAALATALAKSFFKVPVLAKSALGGLLDVGRRKQSGSK